MKGPNFLGPMDKFTKSIDSCSIGGRSLRQQNINESLFKERTSSVQEYVAQWVYEAGIPFNAIDNDSFKRMVQAVGVFFKPPSPWQLRETLLKKMVEKTRVAIKNQEEKWNLTGCSIMTDAWTDRKRRSIMNLCVNCGEGTTFLSSKECSDEAHTGEFIFQYVLKAIQQVGAHNVVQIVTDNASNNMAAAKLLKDKMPHVFWSSCATHTINLMLESIGKQPKYKKFIDSAKAFTIFVYAHHKTLSLMRSFTKKRDIVRPGVTRFASSFLSLESLVEKKDGLRQMFTSGEWEKCKWANTVKGREAYSTMVSLSFWNGVNLCLKAFGPLVKVFRLVDGDRKPSMAFLYGELLQAKPEIKEALNNVEQHYLPIFAIIDEKAEDRLDTSLHLTAYLLNPYYFYKDLSIFGDKVVSTGFTTFAEMYFPNNLDMQDIIVNIKFTKYSRKEGSFGKPLAAKGCLKNDDNYDPIQWWKMYGSQTPNLQKVAVRILSLTSGSFGCKRNWSTFEGIHTKKMKRLDVGRLDSLVYVKFNATFLNRHKRLREKGKKVEVLQASDASNAYEWVVDENDEEVELGLEADDDTEEEIEVQFESDEERDNILGGGDED